MTDFFSEKFSVTNIFILHTFN